MTLLPILMLAAGLNTAAYPASPVSHARQAEATLNRLVTSAEPTLRHRALDQALSANTAAFNRTARQSPRLAPPARQAEIAMNRMVEKARTRLAARAIDAALTLSLHGYSRALAGEIARARSTYEIARQTVTKSTAVSLQ